VPAQRLEAAADPFAAPDPFAAKPSAATAPMNAPIRVDPIAQTAVGAPPYAAPQPPVGFQRADDMADQIAGMPTGRPPWLIAVVVGVAALVVGGGIAFVALSR
jgi:hypothetical protein